MKGKRGGVRGLLPVSEWRMMSISWSATSGLRTEKGRRPRRAVLLSFSLPRNEVDDNG
jgi:hypothetical protein